MRFHFLLFRRMTSCNFQGTYAIAGVLLEGGAGGAELPQTLADQLNLFKLGGANYAPHTTASPLRFKKLSTPLQLQIPQLDQGLLEFASKFFSF